MLVTLEKHRILSATSNMVRMTQEDTHQLRHGTGNTSHLSLAQGDASKFNDSQHSGSRLGHASMTAEIEHHQVKVGQC